jgi:glutaredoxin
MSFYSSADVKNELLEPSVHVPTDRTEFRIHGDVLTSLKLVNNAPFGDATSVLNDLVGVLGNIKNIFLYDGKTELTAIRDFNKVMGFKNLMFDNHHNSDIDRLLKRHNIGFQSEYLDDNNNYKRRTALKNVVVNTLPATDTDDNKVRSYFDLREAFNMLQKVPVLSDKLFPQLRLVIEYTRVNQEAKIVTNVAFQNCRPLLALDRIVNPVVATNMVNSVSNIQYNEIEHDRVQVAAIGDNETQKPSRKILGFNGKYVSRLRVRKNFADTSKHINANNVVGFGVYESLAANGEVFQLVLNGRPLFPRSGLEGYNRRLAHLVDTHGEINLYENANIDVHADYNGNALGGNANKGGVLDFFATQIEEKVEELQLDYTRVGTPDGNAVSKYKDALELVVTCDVAKQLQVGNGTYRISYM